MLVSLDLSGRISARFWIRCVLELDKMLGEPVGFCEVFEECLFFAPVMALVLAPVVCKFP